MTRSLSEHPARPELASHVEASSVPIPEAGCWLWTGQIGSHGYGIATIDGEAFLGHRLSFQAFHGAIPVGMLVQHSCDNHWCVAPSHLSLGTDATNAADKMAKGRAAKKLTHRDVLEIRRRIALGEKQIRIATSFGVDQRLIHGIKRRQIWAHVPDEPGVVLPPVPERQQEHPVSCVRGHDLTGEALRISPTGIRSCRECHKIFKRRHRIKKAMGVAS